MRNHATAPLITNYMIKLITSISNPMEVQEKPSAPVLTITASIPKKSSQRKYDEYVFHFLQASDGLHTNKLMMTHSRKFKEVIWKLVQFVCKS